MDKDGGKRKKILTALVILLLISFLCNIIAVLSIFRNKGISWSTINNYNLIQEQLEALNDNFLGQCSAVWYLLSLDNPEETADARGRILDYDAKLEEGFGELRIYAKNKEEINALSAAGAKLEEYRKARDEAVSYHIKGDSQKAMELMKELSVLAANEPDEMFKPLIQQFSSGLEDVKASVEQSFQFCIYAMTGMSSLSAAALVLACFAAVKH